LSILTSRAGGLRIAMRLPDRYCLDVPWMAIQKHIQDNVRVEQDAGHPYFLTRSCSTIRSHSASSGGGVAVCSRPTTSLRAMFRGGSEMDADSSVSRTLRASTIRHPSPCTRSGNKGDPSGIVSFVFSCNSWFLSFLPRERLRFLFIFLPMNIPAFFLDVSLSYSCPQIFLPSSCVPEIFLSQKSLLRMMNLGTLRTTSMTQRHTRGA
jgi:hypothetical protein